MKVLMICPPGIKPLMPSRNTGSVSGILKDIFGNVDVIDANVNFYTKIYRNEISVSTNKGVAILENKNLNSYINEFKEAKMISRKNFRLLEKEIGIRNHFLSLLIPELSFGMFSVQLKDESKLGIFLSEHRFHKALKQLLDEQLNIDNVDYAVINIDSYKQIYFAALISELLHDKYSCKIMICGEYVNGFIEEGLVTILQAYFDYVVDIDYRRRLFKIFEWSDINEIINNDTKGIITVQSFKFAKNTKLISDLYDKNFFSKTSYFYSFPKYPIRWSIGCCYGKCKFCIQNQEKHKDIQIFDMSGLIFEIIEASKEGYTFFEFVDVNVHAKYLIQFAKMLISKQLHVRWVANTRLYNELLCLDNCRILSESGCRKLFIGFETCNQNILDACGKGIQTEYMNSLLHNLKSVGIVTHISFLFGYPEETEEQAEKTRKFILDNLELIDIAEINRYIEHDKEKITKNSYNVDKYVLDLRKLLEKKGKTPTYYNILNAIR